jgi:hypothetical protein
MATSANFTIDDLLDHPMAVYARESDGALSRVRNEITRLGLVEDDESATEAERNEAQADKLELISVLGQMEDADKAFLARVVVGPFPPKDEVVERTIALNRNLAAVVSAANRVQTTIRLAAQWADTLRAVVTGQAPSMPPEPDPPEGNNPGPSVDS